ncbi:MAG TPA: hypothetical protein VFN30_12890 [Chitinophagaceae bacterium]|nr:hypothetical protein [Chitinophagaceae bacterium]
MKTKFLLLSLIMTGTFFIANAQRSRYAAGINHHERLRIAQGVRSGSLTHAEAARLRFANARVNRYERLAARDGVITPHERRRIRMQERRLNRQIFIQKHDFQRRR